MTVKQKFEKEANLIITDKFMAQADIEISEWSTADGYTVYVMCEDPRRLNWEAEVWYYQPSFDDIMDYIRIDHGNDEPIVIACDDIEQYFDEYYMLDWLASNMDEEEFEKFTEEGNHG